MPTPTTLPLLAYSQHAVLLNDAEMSRKKVESEDQSQNPESVPVLAIDYAYVAHPTEGNTQRDTELGLLGILSYRLLVSWRCALSDLLDGCMWAYSGYIE